METSLYTEHISLEMLLLSVAQVFLAGFKFQFVRPFLFPLDD